MKLGKLVQIGIAHPMPQRRKLQRKNRNLPHVEKLGDIVVVNLQRERMQDVLGIVQGDDLVFAPTGDFARAHGAENRVQAIGLGGRPVMGHDSLVHTRRGFDQLVHAAVRLRIVGIDADEEIVVFVEQGFPRIVRHAVDDSPLVPGRDENGDEFFGFAPEFLERHRRLAPPATESAQELKVEKQVVDSKNEKADRSRVGHQEKEIVKEVHGVSTSEGKVRR